MITISFELYIELISEMEKTRQLQYPHPYRNLDFTNKIIGIHLKKETEHGGYDLNVVTQEGNGRLINLIHVNADTYNKTERNLKLRKLEL